MPVFFIKREYFDALERGEKKAEIRLGKLWYRIAEKIKSGEIRPIAIFKCGRKRFVLKISRIGIYQTLKAALRRKRWKKLGLKAPTYKAAINEIKKLYHSSSTRPAIIFWLSREGVPEEKKQERSGKEQH